MIIESGDYSVYIHINKQNNKIYVGATRKTPTYKRWGPNGSGYRRNKRFYEDIVKYGWDNFEHEVIASGLNESEASNMEKFLINKLNSTNPENGYNYERGGLNHNEDNRCQKISNSLKGENHPAYGKHLSENVKKKIGDSMRGELGYWYGKKLPAETIEKMSKALKDRIIDTEKFNDHTEKVRKPVLCVETGEVYESIKKAALLLNVDHAGISMAANGKRKTAYGKHWKFV